MGFKVNAESVGSCAKLESGRKNIPHRGAATLKLRASKAVWTSGTDKRFDSDERSDGGT